MKTAEDPRHRQRQTLIQELFKFDFHKIQKTSEKAKEIIKQLSLIDNYIQNSAPEFTIDKIHKVDLAILRLAVYELVVAKKEPPHVIIDEAIELAKEFAGDTSPSFINGALGNILKYEKSS